jgi:hypothetical protein
LWLIGVRIFVELNPRMIGSGLSYEMRVIRSVNRLHVDNLGPSGIGGTLSKLYIYTLLCFSVDMRLLFLSWNGGCYITYPKTSPIQWWNPEIWPFEFLPSRYSLSLSLSLTLSLIFFHSAIIGIFCIILLLI